MNRPVSIPRSEGKYSRQAHCDLPEEAPYERETSRGGFFGPATQFHHRHPPTAWSNWQGPLKPRAFDLKGTQRHYLCPWQLHPLLSNHECQLRLWTLSASMPFLVRNSDGDELLFIHEGEGELFCDYGHLALQTGDYLLLPRGTQWRLEVKAPITALMIEATNDQYQLPDKGLVGHHAIFDSAALEHPHINDAFIAQQDDHPWQVKIKRHNLISSLEYPFNPLDALGWHGDVYPVRINWRDIRPLMSHRAHLPPSAHTTFLCKGFVVCTFVPRPIESDPGALKVPFYHSNEEYDEVIFYHAGDFFSRDHIEPGMITYHPTGFPHGPHPKAYANSQNQPKKATDEVAVMVDTRQGLHVNEAALQGCEVENYLWSWRSSACSGSSEA